MTINPADARATITGHREQTEAEALRQAVADEAAMSFGDDCPRDQMNADERAAVDGAWERATA